MGASATQSGMAGMGGPLTDWFWNALPAWAGGEILTADQKAAIADQAARDQVKASAGRVSYADAYKQAVADTENIVQDARERAASDFSMLLTVGGIALGAVVLILALKD